MSYIRRLADAIRREVPPRLVPPDSDDLFLIYAALATSVGTQVTPRNVHDAWVSWMETKGETHASMVPYSALPDDVRREDDPYVSAIRAALRKTASLE